MSDPEILKTARANLQWTVDAWESAGGRVDLTATTLTFRPHLFNASLREPVVIDLRAIISVTPVRQRVLGSIPSPIQNALLIRGADDSFAHVDRKSVV